MNDVLILAAGFANAALIILIVRWAVSEPHIPLPIREVY